jgi:hypothetical protein
MLEVTASNDSVKIHFPFNDLNRSEISHEELTNKLMSVL